MVETLFIGAFFVLDILLVSPTWPTYKPQAEFAGHKTHIIETTFEEEWRVTPRALEEASYLLF